MKIRVILASKSARRHEMLRLFGIRFRAFDPDVEEVWSRRESPTKIVTRLAIEKVKLCPEPDALVIGMDTLVVIGNHKLGKPENAEEVRQMLKLLSNKTHRVYTGIALRMRNQMVAYSAVTKVTFRKVTRAERDWYIESGEPFGKAGAYAIQGLGRLFVDRIDGCFYNVVGFPIASFQRALGKLGLSIYDLME